VLLIAQQPNDPRITGRRPPVTAKRLWHWSLIDRYPDRLDDRMGKRKNTEQEEKRGIE